MRGVDWMKKYTGLLLPIALFTVIFVSCDILNSSKKTSVTLKAVNSTVLFPANQKMILCIHDEKDDSINYSKYSLDRSVTFNDVKPGKYMAHFGTSAAIGERAIRVDIKEGQDCIITFEGYILTYIRINGIDYPKYAMKAYVQYN